MSRYIEEKGCPCAPLHIKCEYDGHNCVGCALHRFNYAVYNALNTLTGRIVKPYYCPMFEPSGNPDSFPKKTLMKKENKEMRLIDADALLDDSVFSSKAFEKTMREFIDDAPTVEQITEKWIPIKSRPMDEDERKEWSEKLGYKLEDHDAVIYTSPFPDDGQEVLICLRSGHIMLDTFEEDFGYCYFNDYDDMENVVAWMPLPKPWREE